MPLLSPLVPFDVCECILLQASFLPSCSFRLFLSMEIVTGSETIVTVSIDCWLSAVELSVERIDAAVALFIEARR